MLYAITSFFNPCGYQSRLQNYHVFREQLNVPLIAIELGFNGHFDLNEDDADVMVRVEDGGVMFQKERLLNLLLENYLPDDCTEVAWLDCDIVFSRDDWAVETTRLLQSVDFVQPFGSVAQANASNWQSVMAPSTNTKTGPAYAKLVHDVGPDHPDITPIDSDVNSCHTGLAWAARRDCLEGVGLFDLCIIGSGDCAIPSLCIGRENLYLSHVSTGPSFGRAYHNWASRLRQQSNLSMSYVPGILTQLSHGDYADRRYSERHFLMQQFEDDATDELVKGADGAWQWLNSSSPIAEFVSDYFWSRQEDSCQDNSLNDRSWMHAYNSLFL